MARKNHRRTRPQARRRAPEEAPLPKRRHLPAPPVETLIVPKGRCHFPHRKLQFSAEEADKALRQAQAKRARLGHTYGEERVYECKVADGGCGSWHLTSRTSYQPRSAK